MQKCKRLLATILSLDIGQRLENWPYHRQNVAMRRLNNTSSESVAALLDRYQLHYKQVAAQEAIPFSFWGTPEAGRNRSTLYVREDTPIHSILHEAAHYICMHPNQRVQSQVDAQGSAIEENACCYLQIVLADFIDGVNRFIMMHDMNRWGYSFRLGSTARWFFADCSDAQDWLLERHILTPEFFPTWQLRQN